MACSRPSAARARYSAWRSRNGMCGSSVSDESAFMHGSGIYKRKDFVKNEAARAVGRCNGSTRPPLQPEVQNLFRGTKHDKPPKPLEFRVNRAWLASECAVSGCSEQRGFAYHRAAPAEYRVGNTDQAQSIDRSCQETE